jgi:hypothetical protein
MIVRVLELGKDIPKRVDAFAKQLQCPNLVEPQIIARCIHSNHNADSQRRDGDRKHGGLEPSPTTHKPDVY